MDHSDEEDDWMNVEEDDRPSWQVGLTAGELVEEDFEAEAILRGGFSRPYLMT